MMKKINCLNSIIKKGTVIEAACNKNTVQIETPDGIMSISAYSPESRGHKKEDRLQEGEEVILRFIKKEFEHTLSGLRKHTLAAIIYPHDEVYQEARYLEALPGSKEEGRVEKAFQKMKEKRTLKN